MPRKSTLAGCRTSYGKERRKKDKRERKRERER